MASPPDRSRKTSLLRQKKPSRRKRIVFGGISDKVLEKEISRIEKEKRKETACFSRFRQRGRGILRSKLFHFAVVALCVLDCSLLMGALILELTVVNAMATAEELKPDHSDCSVTSKPDVGHVGVGGHADVGSHADVGHVDVVHADVRHAEDRQDTLANVAHAFTLASMAIVCLLLVQSFVKIGCFGKRLLSNTFELLGVIAVVGSVVTDMCLMERSTGYTIMENARVISSFILPWRILRLVLSMIVALYDHEHNKLLLMFKSKRYLQNQMAQLSADLYKLQTLLEGLRKMAVENEVPEYEITKVMGNVYLKSKKNVYNEALKTLVSIAIGSAVGNQKIILKRLGDKQSTFEVQEKQQFVAALVKLTKQNTGPLSLTDWRRWSQEYNRAGGDEVVRKRNISESFASGRGLNFRRTSSLTDLPEAIEGIRRKKLSVVPSDDVLDERESCVSGGEMSGDSSDTMTGESESSLLSVYEDTVSHIDLDFDRGMFDHHNTAYSPNGEVNYRAKASTGPRPKDRRHTIAVSEHDQPVGKPVTSPRKTTKTDKSTEKTDNVLHKTKRSKPKIKRKIVSFRPAEQRALVVDESDDSPRIRRLGRHRLIE